MLLIALGSFTQLGWQGSASPADLPHSLRLRYGEDASSTVVVAWGTEEMGAGHAVQYRVGNGPVSSVSASSYTFPSYRHQCETDPSGYCTEAGHGRIHTATLTGLAPSTLYQYRVGSGLLWSLWHTFRTAPAGSTAAVRFTAYGDTMPDPVSAAVASEAAAFDPDFHLHLGDAAYHSTVSTTHEDQWKSWFEHQEPVIADAPYMLAPGNNDISAADDEYVYVSKILPGWDGTGDPAWFFRAGPVGVVGLTHTSDSGESRYSTAQLDALLSRLDDPAIRWRFVTMHAGPYGTGSSHPGACRLREFEPLFEQHRVDFVLAGHNHAFERTFPVRDHVVVNLSTEPGVSPIDYPQGLGTTYVVQGAAMANRYGHMSTNESKEPADWCHSDDTPHYWYEYPVPGTNLSNRIEHPHAISYSWARSKDPSFTTFVADGDSVTVETRTPTGDVVDSFVVRRAS